MLNYRTCRRQALLGKIKTMTGRLIVATIGLLLTFAAAPGQAQVGNSSANGLENGYHSMYNLQFEQAHRAFGEWQSLHPDDPMGPVSEAAAFLLSECDRLHVLEMEFDADGRKPPKRERIAPDLQVKKEFESLLEKTRALAEARLTQNSRDAGAIFARILMDSLRGDYLALVENRDHDALRYLKQSRVLAESLIAADPTFYDAYLAVGVENYMTGLRSAAVRWIMRAGGAQTDKAAGLRNLKIAAERGHYLAPFARMFLAIAALRDHDSGHALELMESLAREFPENRFYTRQLALLRLQAHNGAAAINNGQ